MSYDMAPYSRTTWECIVVQHEICNRTTWVRNRELLLIFDTKSWKMSIIYMLESFSWVLHWLKTSKLKLEGYIYKWECNISFILAFLTSQWSHHSNSDVMEKTVECQLNAFYGTLFFIAFYNDDSAVPSVTSNRYHAIVMFYTETNFHYSLEKVSRGESFACFWMFLYKDIILRS